MPIKLSLRVVKGKCRLITREMPDLTEAKARWLAGEDPFPKRRSRKTKMERRRIRKRLERQAGRIRD